MTMGACDPGRCCKGATCTSDKKCCCQAKKGTHTAGEVCRTSSCTTNGTCENNVPICACLTGGGTLTQACDPCDNVFCNKCEQCVNGVCVSTCSICQVCDTSSINGTCVAKTCSPACGQCQECRCFNGQTSCVVTGVICGAGCCSLNECCVNGACVPCDCTGQIKPGPCYECVNGSYVPILGTPCGTLCCTPGLECCNGVCCPNGQFCSNDHCCPTGQKWCGSACKECCVDGDCAAGKVCENGVCVTPTCCKWEPACAPGGFGSYASGNLCDPRGTAECPVIITPVRCTDARCQYEWDGSAWINPTCVVLLQGNYVAFGCNCTASGCTPPSASGAVVGDINYGGSCVTASNPLP